MRTEVRDGRAREEKERRKSRSRGWGSGLNTAVSLYDVYKKQIQYFTLTNMNSR